MSYKLVIAEKPVSYTHLDVYKRQSFLLFVLFKKYLLESGVDNDHIIEIALDGIENEELSCLLYTSKEGIAGSG